MTLGYFTVRGETVDRPRRADARGGFAAGGAGSTHYEVAGPSDGELVVLIGGLTVPLAYWDGLTAELHSRGFRTLAYSAYGRGLSDRVLAAYDESLFTAQLDDLLDVVGVTPQHVVGSSMGALIAMSFVLHRTDVRTLTVVGPAGLAARGSGLAALLRVPVLGRIGASLLGPRVLEGHTRRDVGDPDRVAALREMILPHFAVKGSMYALCATLVDFPLVGRRALFEAVGASGPPTLLLWGRDDQVTPVSGFDDARGLLGAARAEIVPNCGHMVPFERAALTAGLFAEFATSTRNGT